jgi:hypothetical protein
MRRAGGAYQARGRAEARSRPAPQQQQSSAVSRPARQHDAARMVRRSPTHGAAAGAAAVVRVRRAVDELLRRELEKLARRDLAQRSAGRRGEWIGHATRARHNGTIRPGPVSRPEEAGGARNSEAPSACSCRSRCRCGHGDRPGPGADAAWGRPSLGADAAWGRPSLGADACTCDSRTSVAENAQQEPQPPWSFTGEQAPLARQSIDEGSWQGGSSIKHAGMRAVQRDAQVWRAARYNAPAHPGDLKLRLRYAVPTYVHAACMRATRSPEDRPASTRSHSKRSRGAREEDRRPCRVVSHAGCIRFGRTSETGLRLAMKSAGGSMNRSSESTFAC